MRIAICDDNRFSVDRLTQLIVDYFANIDKTCTLKYFLSPESLLDADLSSVHIVFLDIDMPKINGIEAATILRRKYPDIFIVFVTCWIQYARDGYHVRAFRYLLKQKLEDELPSCLDAVRFSLARSQESIQLQGIELPLEVPVDDICYIEGSSHRTFTVHLIDKTLIECRGKLSDVTEELRAKGFLRIQRSYAVNMRHISQIKGYKATLRSGEELKASERCYREICQEYLLWKGQQL